jgi:hypothetical protein
VVVKHFGRDSIRHQQVLDAAIPGCHFVQAGNGDSDVEFEVQVDALQMNSDLATQRLVAEIVFAILRHLYLNAHSEPRAIGLANSIWHSLRVDAVSGEAGELPDDVGDWLFSHPGVVGTHLRYCSWTGLATAASASPGSSSAPCRMVSFGSVTIAASLSRNDRKTSNFHGHRHIRPNTQRRATQGEMHSPMEALILLLRIRANLLQSQIPYSDAKCSER